MLRQTLVFITFQPFRENAVQFPQTWIRKFILATGCNCEVIGVSLSLATLSQQGFWAGIFILATGCNCKVVGASVSLATLSQQGFWAGIYSSATKIILAHSCAVPCPAWQ